MPTVVSGGHFQKNGWRESALHLPPLPDFYPGDHLLQRPDRLRAVAAGREASFAKERMFCRSFAGRFCVERRRRRRRRWPLPSLTGPTRPRGLGQPRVKVAWPCSSPSSVVSVGALPSAWSAAGKERAGLATSDGRSTSDGVTALLFEGQTFLLRT